MSVVKPVPDPWSLHCRHRPTEGDKDVRSSGTSKVFTIFTDPTIMHLGSPSEFCITIVSKFSRALQSSQEKWLCKVLGGKQGALWSGP